MAIIKTVLVVAIGLLMVVVGLGIYYRADLQLVLVRRAITPDHDFAERPPPTPPDYSNPSHWAALPDREDLADTLIAGSLDGQAGSPVDVFFVHPTTFLTGEAWNQSIDDGETNNMTDEMVMQGQASVFNGCCRVFAPRYRQATLMAFSEGSESGTNALALAFGDVVAAFRYFVANLNDGRPFVMASHSQGSRHLDLLLEQEVVGTEPFDRMVAAYLVGFTIDHSNGVAVCETPTQTGCQVTWNTVGPRAGALLDDPNNICVNPLTWRTDGLRAGHEVNLGGLISGITDATAPGVVDAQCRDGRLLVSEIRSDQYSARPLGRDNYHIYDYAFFYMNIRENVQARVDAFMNR
jgi:hypothetical protein